MSTPEMKPSIMTKTLVYGEAIQGDQGSCVIADAGDVLIQITSRDGSTTSVTVRPATALSIAWDLLGHYYRAKRIQSKSRQEERS